MCNYSCLRVDKIYNSFITELTLFFFITLLINLSIYLTFDIIFSATSKLRVFISLALYTLPNPPYPTTDINSKFVSVNSINILLDNT